MVAKARSTWRWPDLTFAGCPRGARHRHGRPRPPAPTRPGDTGSSRAQSARASVQRSGTLVLLRRQPPRPASSEGRSICPLPPPPAPSRDCPQGRPPMCACRITGRDGGNAETGLSPNAGDGGGSAPVGDVAEAVISESRKTVSNPVQGWQADGRAGATRDGTVSASPVIVLLNLFRQTEPPLCSLPQGPNEVDELGFPGEGRGHAHRLGRAGLGLVGRGLAVGHGRLLVFALLRCGAPPRLTSRRAKGAPPYRGVQSLRASIAGPTARLK